MNGRGGLFRKRGVQHYAVCIRPASLISQIPQVGWILGDVTPRGCGAGSSRNPRAGGTPGEATGGELMLAA
jgi:hypothetical protein